MTHIVTAEEAGKRLDVLLAAIVEITRSQASSRIEEGCVLVNNALPKKSGASLREGDLVDIELPDPVPLNAKPQDIPLEIVYQDSDLAVVYKPSGMVVHPAAGNPDGTLVNALLYHLRDLSSIGGTVRPGIVHRIDKDTSGLLLVAKNDRSHLSLSEQIKEHSVDRAYLSIVIGHMKEPSGDVNAPIGRHPTERKKMAIVPNGRPALTHWRVLEQLKGADCIEAVLSTGRTHQIRVHMASLGHPVLGDPVYGPKHSPCPVDGGQLLHAFRIGFTHPSTGERMLFEAPPEERFVFWREKLKL